GRNNQNEISVRADWQTTSIQHFFQHFNTSLQTCWSPLVKELPTGRPIPVLVRRDRGALFLALTIPEKE
ncbi:MAG: hypothetical protein R6X17_02715, partial [Candidatus Competibacteraceae bacterium]